MTAAALFYGDAMITPAISVLSAVEGLNLATPAFEPYVIPLSLGILVLLFAVQSRGTAAVAFVFGPITAVWFAAMAVGGAVHLLRSPAILAAISPCMAWPFWRSTARRGSSRSERSSWPSPARRRSTPTWAISAASRSRPHGSLVLPSLALNYLGQGALLLDRPEALENPFYLLYPAWALIPMVVLATMATIIASQAVITGAFSLTQQAIQLGLLPRMDIRRTSETEKGQIYIPRINWMLLLAWCSSSTPSSRPAPWPRPTGSR